MASPGKRARQNLRMRRKNRAVKEAVREAVRKVRDALKEGKKDEARAALTQAVPVIDKAVSQGVLHRNNASRKISRLSSQVLG